MYLFACVQFVHVCVCVCVCLCVFVHMCLCVCVCTTPLSSGLAVFLARDQAHGLLIRPKRANSGWFEELKTGDLERECLEEKCSKEEAREVFEHEQATVSACFQGFFFPFTYINTFFMSAFKAIPDSCLHENGGCEHFCEEEGGRRNCSCADGYFLGTDGQRCLTQDVPLDPRSRIVGGTECPKGHCPWQVLLVRNEKGFCGGVIYKPTWILTASHCLENIKAQHLKVVAGEHDTEKDEGTEQTIDVAEIIMHNSYVSDTADSDIALLRLKTAITMTPFAVPVCLPTRSMAERELWAINLHTVSGWGRRSENGPTSRVLRRLEVPRIRTQDCVEMSGVTLTANMFCAGYIEGKQDSCKGDSGGPLVTRYRDTTFLLGIVSWGKGCARPGNYGIYTRVSNYLDWIHNYTAEQPTVQPTTQPTAQPQNTTTTLQNTTANPNAVL
uniref:Coagulation factor VII n=1 Tax=Oncorhynchus mykiss TaxID=8022 RepID=A0A8C7UBS0_ONCMY